MKKRGDDDEDLTGGDAIVFGLIIIFLLSMAIELTSAATPF